MKKLSFIVSSARGLLPRILCYFYPEHENTGLAIKLHHARFIIYPHTSTAWYVFFFLSEKWEKIEAQRDEPVCLNGKYIVIPFCSATEGE